MENLYRYSPIKNESELFDAVYYTANKAGELSEKITGKAHPISTLTIFSHYPEEYEHIKQILLTLGEVVGENNGPYVKLHTPILSDNKLQYLRIRQPDPYRMQVGCCDFEIPNYDEFKGRNIPSPNLRVIERPEYEMIEFYHPDYDVFAYIVSKQIL